MVPADRRLHALRDATGTVPSIPLISSSIMSKKLAEGLTGLVLDVKTGSGAFMSDLERARELAKTMVGIGLDYGVNTIALITDMTQPLENEVGTANEIAESITVLRGEGQSDVTELTMALGEVMLELGDVEGGRDRLTEAITSGAALQKSIDVTVAHGGDPAVIDDPSLLAQASNEAVITASVDGYVTRCDALTIGITATRLGAGRERTANCDRVHPFGSPNKTPPAPEPGESRQRPHSSTDDSSEETREEEPNLEPRPMKFGAFVPQGWRWDLAGIPVEEHWPIMMNIAQLIESSGFDSLWVYDHFHNWPESEWQDWVANREDPDWVKSMPES